MNFQYTMLSSAVLSALSSLSFAQSTPASENPLPQVIVTAAPFGNAESEQILAPAKVLSGDELRNKLGASLGETVAQELGVSASAFGAGASRPIIRGLEGSRVKMLENGMAVSDVSGLSNDHAVSANGGAARQIEILRGPAALLYGSGAIGGLVNVVNERIPVVLKQDIGGQAEVRASTVDRGRNASTSLDGAMGNIGFHIDGNVHDANDYNIPGNRVAGDPDSESGKLRRSANRFETLGAGASLLGAWGHAGASVSTLDHLYSIPSLEGPRIDLNQTRYDIDSLFKEPLSGLEHIKLKFGYTDYEHVELNDENEAEIKYTNRALESRLEAGHQAIAGWKGTFGLQTERSIFSGQATDGGVDTVPVTRSRSMAAFLVEEKRFGALNVNLAARLETVKRTPITLAERRFDLVSYSLGGMWTIAPGYDLGLTGSFAQRAPSTEELYSDGPHEATETFDVGNADFRKETSRNLELSLQKNQGLLRWKGNLFLNKIKDFIYGDINGELIDDELNLRLFRQADASVRGAEAEVSYNQQGQGLSLRAFSDTARGRLDHGGNLPLQPATRVGGEAAYRAGALRAGISLVHAMEQDRLAEHEQFSTPSYNQLNANLAYTIRYAKSELTLFLLAKNMLNEDIRLSTSVLKEVSPLPGRNFVFGVRAKF